LFNSDWSTDRGTSTAAIRDTDKSPAWNDHLNDGGNTIEVISASGLNFPSGMTNVLRATLKAPTASAGNARAQNLWDAPADGGHLYYRVYFRNGIVQTRADPTGHHACENPKVYFPGESSGNTWHWGHDSATATNYRLHFVTNGTAFPNDRWGVGGLGGAPMSKNHTYRLEWHFTRVGNNFTLELRVYNESGALVYDSEDFLNDSNGKLSDYGGTFGVTDSDWAYMRGLWVGENDWNNWSHSNDEPQYWGGVCLRSDDWCGPYSGGV
jgi:hypothetical protein